MTILPFLPGDDPEKATNAQAAATMFVAFQESGLLSHGDAIKVLRKAFGERFYAHTIVGYTINSGVLRLFRQHLAAAGGRWYARSMYWKLKPGMSRPPRKPLVPTTGAKLRFSARL